VPFGLLADGLLIVHALFVVFVMAGGLLVPRWPGLAALWGAAIEFAGFTCPLTPIEKAWRHAAGEPAYEGGFVEHYVTAALYPAGLTRPIQVLLGSLVLGVNVWVYWKWWRRKAWTS
jgi:hypothetical protein